MYKNEWNVQLAVAYEKLNLKQSEVFYISKKVNGNRCSHLNGRLISRQGNDFSGVGHIIQDINECGLSEFFIDGEFVSKNVNNLSDEENFRISNGIINSLALTKTDIKFVIFDIFPKSEFINNQKSLQTYEKRKENLLKLKKLIMEKSIKNIEIVEMLYEGNDIKVIDNLLDEAVSFGWEGLILNKNTQYKCNRTPNVVKIKQFHTVDLKVIGWEQGTGRLENTIGALKVEFNGNVVSVGTGMDDSCREELWADRKEIIGKIVEIKYKDISKNKKTGLESLQFPVFVRTRYDKNSISLH